MENGREGAFACVDSEHQYLQVGLTKREYFAAMAMQGLLSNQEGVRSLVNKNISIDEYAVKCADRLLAELDRTKSE